MQYWVAEYSERFSGMSRKWIIKPAGTFHGFNREPLCANLDQRNKKQIFYFIFLLF